MNAERHLPAKAANRPAPGFDAFSIAGKKLGQRIMHLRELQAKYDAMLYLVEFMVSVQSFNTKDPARAQTIADLKALVLLERDRLGLRQSDRH